MTINDIEASIADEHYFTAGDGVHYLNPEGFAPDALERVTFCVLITHSGHIITGEAIAQAGTPLNFEVGRSCARADAIRKFWPMAVYAEQVQA